MKYFEIIQAYPEWSQPSEGASGISVSAAGASGAGASIVDELSSITAPSTTGADSVTTAAPPQQLSATGAETAQQLGGQQQRLLRGRQQRTRGVGQQLTVRTQQQLLPRRQQASLLSTISKLAHMNNMTIQKKRFITWGSWN